MLEQLQFLIITLFELLRILPYGPYPSLNWQELRRVCLIISSPYPVFLNFTNYKLFFSFYAIFCPFSYMVELLNINGEIFRQCLSQDLENGCLKLAIVKFLGVQIFKGDHNILIFQP